MLIRVGDEPIYLFLEPKDTLEIEINYGLTGQAGYPNWLKFKGNNKAGHQFFDRYNYSPSAKFKAIYGVYARKDTRSTRQLCLGLKTAITQALAPLDRLYKESLISRQYYLTIKADMQGILADEARKLLRSALKKELASRIKDFDAGTVREFIYQTFNPLDSQLLGTVYDKYYQKTFLKEVSEGYLFNGQIRLASDSFWNQVKISAYCRVAPPSFREKLWANDLLMICMMLQDSSHANEVKYEIDLFKQKFPASSFRQVLEKSFAGLILRTKGQVPVSGEGVIWIDDIPAPASLESLIHKKFVGKYVLIDIWASWCLPCIEKFKRLDTLRQLLDNESIELVFASLDKPIMRPGVERIINEYRLTGFHLLASDSLAADFSRILFNGKSLEIPAFILVNPEGRILNDEKNMTKKELGLMKQASMFFE